jgi:hypothetical protein
MTLSSNDVTSTIQLALAPVFLLTAIVTLITAISGRLARIFDRMRFLHRELLSIGKLAPSLEAHYRVEFRQSQLRGRMCAIAIFFDVLGGVLISLTVLGLFFFENSGGHLSGSYVIGTFVAGLISFMTALVVVLIEVVYAHHSIAWDLPLDPEEKG